MESKIEALENQNATSSNTLQLLTPKQTLLPSPYEEDEKRAFSGIFFH